MASLETPICEFGLPAVNFSLKGVDNKIWTLEQCRGDKGLLVMFICNHCPYVQAIRDRIVRDVNQLRPLGINAVAINSNDAVNYPDDSFENMQKVAQQYDFNFPYLYDDTQAVAKAYGAVCTPDFFGYNADLRLQYRGRLDASGRQKTDDSVTRELFNAMSEIAQTGHGPKAQIPSIGCSIKWKT